MPKSKMLTLTEAVSEYQKDGFKVISDDTNGVKLEKPKSKPHVLFWGGLLLILPLPLIGVLMVLTAVTYYWFFAKPTIVFLERKPD
jgi:hypothetical protein